MTALGTADATKEEVETGQLRRRERKAQKAREVGKGRQIGLHGPEAQVTVSKRGKIVEEGGLKEREVAKAMESAEASVGRPSGTVTGEGRWGKRLGEITSNGRC